MADTVQMNYNVRPETREIVEKIAELTHRKPGQTIDWLVEEAWNRMQEARRAQTTIQDAIAHGAQS